VALREGQVTGETDLQQSHELAYECARVNGCDVMLYTMATCVAETKDLSDGYD